MAQKEASIYIIDVGKTTKEKGHGRDKTNLEWSMEYVWDKITTTVATGRKTAMVGVIGLRTDGTNVDGLGFDDPEEYSNITVFEPLKQFFLEDIRKLQEQVKPSRTNNGDAISAIVVGIQMIANATRGKTGNKLKYTSKIYLVTDGRGYLDAEDVKPIAQKLKAEDVELTILGVDFDDPDEGFKEEDKDPEKARNEQILKSFADDCGATFSTLLPAVESTKVPRLKAVRSVANYKGSLTLGNTEEYDSALSIDIERYPRIMVAKPPTASSHTYISDDKGQNSTQSTHTVTADGEDGKDGETLANVHNQRTYQVDDDAKPGDKKNVSAEDLSRGYEYGRTAVAISESESNIVDLENDPQLDIIGFIPEENFDRYLPMSKSCVIVAQRTNEKAQLALSSFIHALYEAESFAIARLVAKQNKKPLMLLLSPLIEGDFEALVDVELPFAEDIRNYKFPPLDKKILVSGKTITEHRDIPTSDLLDAMSDYVDAMDLSTFDRDDEGNPAEYLPIDARDDENRQAFAPLLHRVNQVIRWRATDPFSSAIPPPPDILLKYSQPPEKLVHSAHAQLKALKETGDVKKVPPKQKGRGKRTREREKPLSGLDVDELLGKPKKVKIDRQNAIPTFKQALAVTDDLAQIKEAAKDMGETIYEYIRDSLGSSAYGRAIEAIQVMRNELVDLEEPGLFNEFVRRLKRDILDGKLKGDRREMWWMVRRNRLGLVDKRVSAVSDVEEQEAEEFYRVT